MGGGGRNEGEEGREKGKGNRRRNQKRENERARRDPGTSRSLSLSLTHCLALTVSHCLALSLRKVVSRGVINMYRLMCLDRMVSQHRIHWTDHIMISLLWLPFIFGVISMPLLLSASRIYSHPCSPAECVHMLSMLACPPSALPPTLPSVGSQLTACRQLNFPTKKKSPQLELWLSRLRTKVTAVQL